MSDAGSTRVVVSAEVRALCVNERTRCTHLACECHWSSQRIAGCQGVTHATMPLDPYPGMEVERHQVEVEHAHALASEAQLAVLRARIHPHFLFNALNSIAELCCIAPERAEAASVRLSQLMRRALDTSARTASATSI